jgi:hypothetical protein
VRTPAVRTPAVRTPAVRTPAVRTSTVKASTVVPPPGAGADAEALIREARRRQRRRYAAGCLAAAAVLAVLAGALGAFAGHPGTSRPRPASKPPVKPAASHPAGPQSPGPIPRSLDTTVLMWPVGYPAFTPAGGPPAYFDNLSTGRVSQQQDPAISAGDFQPLLITVGRWFVYVGNGSTAIRDDLKGRPRALGKTPFFAPSAVADRVWLEYGFLRRDPSTVRSVAVTGGPPGPAITLPKGAWLVEGTDAGLLLRDRRGGLELWNPGAAPTVLPHSAFSGFEGFDASARLVAYGTGCSSYVTARNASYEPNAGYDACRVLRAFNVVTGQLRSFAAPPGTAGWVPNGFGLVSAIRPGDRMIAAYAAVRPHGDGRTRLYVLRLAGARRRVAAVPSSAAFLYARTGWSARGSWLLYQGPGVHLWAYQVTTGRVRSSRTSCCQYTVMATVRSPPAGGASGDHRAGGAGSGP